MERSVALPSPNQTDDSVYVCAACGTALFDAGHRFEAGCGFPSFWDAIENRVKQNPLATYGRSRIQLLCQHCGTHLGHLFPNKHTASGQRFCINHSAIKRLAKKV